MIAITDRERDFGGNQSSSSSSSSSTSTRNFSRSTTASKHHSGHNPIVREIKKHRRKQKTYINTDSGNDSSSTNTITPSSAIANPQINNIDQDTEIPIKFRLSNGKEHRLYCKSNEKIRQIKRRLAMLENGDIDSQSQRLFFGGKLLRMYSTIRRRQRKKRISVFRRSFVDL